MPQHRQRTNPLGSSSAEKDLVLVDKSNMSNWCTCVEMNANNIPGFTINSRSSDYSYCPAIKKYLEDCVQFCIFSIRDVSKQEQVQQWPTKMARRLKHCEERLKYGVCLSWRRINFRGPQYCFQLSKKG